MSLPTLTAEQLAQFKTFVDACIANPKILNEPNLAFVKEFIEHFGGKVPESPSKKPEEAPKEAEMKEEPESEESDLELDMSGVIEPDPHSEHPMGDSTVEPTEEQINESQQKRSEAMAAFMEKDYEKAVQLYTEAILLNPQAVLLYAKRGQAFLSLNKPNACIRDCNRALELNPDSAAAHKFRGRAYGLLGKFEEAANDLRLACQFDFDEQTDEWLREVTPNAKRIEEHKRKYERKQQEKRERERQERVKRAKEANKKAEEESGSTAGGGSTDEANIPNFFAFMNDSDVIKCFKQNPKMGQVFAEIAKNPTSIFKYQNDPTVMAFINEAAAKFAGAGGSPDSQNPPPPPPPPSAGDFKPQDDIGLD